MILELELLQEHPVLDVLSGMNQGGQRCRWAVGCDVKLDSRMISMEITSAVIVLCLCLMIYTNYGLVTYTLQTLAIKFTLLEGT